MGILADFLKRFRPLEVADEFFGRLTYMKMPKGRVSYWEATRTFAPSGREIELFVDAPGPELLPNESQRQFFLTVEGHYSGIVASVEAVLRPQFEAWCRAPLALPFEREFTLTSFSIPNMALADAQWEMSFDSHTDQNHLFSVSLVGERATGVTIDG